MKERKAEGGRDREGEAHTEDGILSTHNHNSSLPENAGMERLSPEEEKRQKETEEREKRVREGEERERRSRQLREGLHPLQNRFILWYTRRPRGAAPASRTQLSYEDNIKRVVEFSTVEDFWRCYSHLTRVSSMPQQSDFHLFKEGIRPLWEDVNNKNGGKWVLRFKRGLAGRYWEDLVLAFLGEQLDMGDTVCGVVLSVRYNEDLISVWNRDAPDTKSVNLLKESIRKHLQLPSSYQLEYKPHDVALKDMSSFRNTWVRT